LLLNSGGIRKLESVRLYLKPNILWKVCHIIKWENMECVETQRI
jgi:hypothetical protein